MPRLAVFGIAFLFVASAWLAVAPRAASALPPSGVQVVTLANTQGWGFYTGSQTNPDFVGTPATANVDLVFGPGSPPAGAGSALLTVGSNGNDAVEIRHAGFAGTKLSDITSLTYSTFVTENLGGQAAYLTIVVDLDEDDVPDGGLFFEPAYQNGEYGGDPVPNQCPGIPNCVALDTWQEWDARAGGWWLYTGGPPLVTLDSIIADNPNARIVNRADGLGGVRITAGYGAGAWQDFVGNADEFSIGIGGTVWTYDFEPLGACEFSDDPVSRTRTLLSDCQTDATIFVPDGWTLYGAGHAILAVDPVGGHFLGAVVQNAGAKANVMGLTVSAFRLANVCDPSVPMDTRLRGILFRGASGDITGNMVKDINQGASGCQEGNGIEVRNPPYDGTHPLTLGVTIRDNVVINYQKNGITVNGDVRADVGNNVVAGAGPVAYIAQNGIQFGYGAEGKAEYNTVEGNWYTPSSWVATGILVFEADGVRVTRNTIAGSQVGVAVEAWCWFAASADENLVERNAIDGAQLGVSVAAYSIIGYSSCPPSASGNSVTANLIGPGTDVGISVDSYSDPGSDFPALVQMNGISSNQVTGSETAIQVYGTGQGVRNNILTGGASLTDTGIEVGAAASDVRNNRISGYYVGIRVSGDGSGVRNNVIIAESGGAGYGIKATGRENMLELNMITGDGVDALDVTTGDGTAGTANTWRENKCDFSVPSGLCRHQVPPTPWSFYGDANPVVDSGRPAMRLQSTCPTGSPTCLGDGTFTDGGIVFSAPTGLTVAGISELSAEFKVTAGGCAGGAPRFTLFVDRDGSGAFDAPDHQGFWIYFGTPPYGGGCLPDWQSTGNYVTYTEPRVADGNVFYAWADFAALHGTKAVWYVTLDVDAGWAFPPSYLQTVLVRDVRVNSYVLMG